MPGLLGAQRREQGLGHPEVEKALDPFDLDPLGEVLVCRLTGAPGGLVLDPGAGADKDEPGHFLGMGQGDVQGGATTHRVPGPGCRARHETGQEVGRSPQVGLDVRRPTMAGRVRQHKGGRPAGQSIDHRRPRGPALGETVEQHQGRRSRSFPAIGPGTIAPVALAVAVYEAGGEAHVRCH